MQKLLSRNALLFYSKVFSFLYNIFMRGFPLEAGVSDFAKRSNKRLVTYSTFQYTVIQLYKYGEPSETSLSFEIIV